MCQALCQVLCINVNSFNPHNNLRRLLLSSFYSWGNWGNQRSRIHMGQIWTQSFLTTGLTLHPLPPAISQAKKKSSKVQWMGVQRAYFIYNIYFRKMHCLIFSLPWNLKANWLVGMVLWQSIGLGGRETWGPDLGPLIWCCIGGWWLTVQRTSQTRRSHTSLEDKHLHGLMPCQMPLPHSLSLKSTWTDI